MTEQSYCVPFLIFKDLPHLNLYSLMSPQLLEVYLSNSFVDSAPPYWLSALLLEAWKCG